LKLIIDVSNKTIRMTFISRISFIALLPFVLTDLGQHQNMGTKVSIGSLRADTSYSTTGLFKPGTQPLLISEQFTFTEGPAADNAGNVYFTDQPNNSIWKYTTAGELKLFSNQAGRSNGMYFDKKGYLITCADQDNEIWQFKSTGERIAVLLNDVNGHRLNGPNDLWIDAKGGIYFTDPYYQRPYWSRNQSELDGEKVYYLPVGSKQPVVASSALQKPNGIAGTANGKFLYVADIKANKTFRFRIAADGSLTDQQTVVEKGSDGLTFDDKGNLYLTSNKGVYIFDANGQQIGLIAIPQPWTANVCFGGKDRKTLFITSSKAVYKFQMNVSGYTKNASRQR
jgi:gluconolactonase